MGASRPSMDISVEDRSLSSTAPLPRLGSTSGNLVQPNSALLESPEKTSTSRTSKSISQLPPVRQAIRFGGMRKSEKDHMVSPGWTGYMDFEGVNHRAHRGAKTASSVDISLGDGDLDWDAPIKPYSRHTQPIPVL